MGGCCCRPPDGVSTTGGASASTIIATAASDQTAAGRRQIHWTQPVTVCQASCLPSQLAHPGSDLLPLLRQVHTQLLARLLAQPLLRHQLQARVQICKTSGFELALADGRHKAAPRPPAGAAACPSRPALLRGNVPPAGMDHQAAPQGTLSKAPGCRNALCSQLPASSHCSNSLHPITSRSSTKLPTAVPQNCRSTHVQVCFPHDVVQHLRDPLVAGEESRGCTGPRCSCHLLQPRFGGGATQQQLEGPCITAAAGGPHTSAAMERGATEPSQAPAAPATHLQLFL